MRLGHQRPPATVPTAASLLLPNVLLRVEGLLLFALSLYLYFWLGGGWLLLLVLFLAADISMLGYLAGPRPGAMVYNLGHSYPLPAALGLIGFLSATPLAMLLSLIWFAHIGFDRTIGYGLKHPDSFKRTHLGELGGKRG